MTCNTTELIDKLQRASRDTPGVSSREDIAYALLTVAAGYLAGGDADTVRRITSKLEREAPLRGSPPSPGRRSQCRYHQGDMNNIVTLGHHAGSGGFLKGMKEKKRQP